MSLLRPKAERRTDPLDLDDVLAQAFGTSVPGNIDGLGRLPILTDAGVYVTPRSALKNPAVWRCEQIIAGTICSLPVDAYRKGDDGARVEVTPTPKILTSPSGEFSARHWKWQAMESLLFDGNIVGQIASRDGLGYPTQVELVDMTYVRVMRDPSTGRWKWFIYGQEVPTEDIWHVAYNPPPGWILGRSLLEHAAQVIGTGIAAMKYGASFFGDGAHPTMVMKNTLSALSKDQATAVKDRIKSILSGVREPLVIGREWETSPWQSTPEDSMLVDVWASNVTNVSLYFGVPPEYLGGKVSESMTYSNLEARHLDLYSMCLSIWASPLECKLTDSISSPRYVKFNWDAFLRGDTLTRYQVHETAIRIGMNSPDERRSLEDEAPIPGGKGKEYLWPPMTTGKVQTDTPGAVQPLKPGETAPPKGSGT